MTWELLAILAAITYGSRALALVFLPSLSPRVREVINRVPPALFAALAAYSVVVPGEGFAPLPILAATAGAIVVTPLRSLPVCLVAGVVAYAACELLT